MPPLGFFNLLRLLKRRGDFYSSSLPFEILVVSFGKESPPLSLETLGIDLEKELSGARYGESGLLLRDFSFFIK